MSEDAKTKTIRKFVFIYPDTRPDAQSNIMGEGFEVSESDGDTVESSGDSYVFTVQIKKTIVEKVDGKKDTVSVVPTGRTKTIRVRPAYLWVEEETVVVPVA